MIDAFFVSVHHGGDGKWGTPSSPLAQFKEALLSPGQHNHSLGGPPLGFAI